jgi:hypothetical protein
VNILEDDIRAVLHSQAKAMEVPEPHRNGTTNVTLIDIEPTWTQPEGRHRWPIIIVAAAAVVAVVVGSLVIATRTDDPTEEVPADQPTTVAPATTVAPHRETGAFEFGPGVTYIVPDGWETIGPGRRDSMVIKRDPFIAVDLRSAGDNFYTSFCRTTSGAIDAAPVGPTVDDLVAAWANLPGVDATAARDATIDGFDAKQIDITIPDHIEEDCTGMYFRCAYASEEPSPPIRCSKLTPDPFYGPNVHQRVWVLDNHGTRLLIAARYVPDASQQDRAALDEIVASIEFD